MVLARRADHRRTADVDVFDGVGNGRVLTGDGLFERVEIDDEQVDRVDAVFFHDGLVDAAAAEQAAVDNRMQGFYSSVHDFRKPGPVGDFHDLEAGLAQLPASAARGQDLDAEIGETLDEWNQATLVRNTDERASYLEHD